LSSKVADSVVTNAQSSSKGKVSASVKRGDVEKQKHAAEASVSSDTLSAENAEVLKLTRSAAANAPEAEPPVSVFDYFAWAKTSGATS
jgi:hypothetical protein